MEPPYESRNAIIRGVLSAGALVLLTTGAIFTIIGLVDFFGAFSGHGRPTKFWCLFVGLPLLSLGGFCFKAAFLRTITGYVAGEAAPIVRDTVDYVAKGLSPTLRNLADAESQTDGQQDPAERLRNLEALRQEGLISESEYATKRQDILSEI
jgi:hypothetical protein